MWSSRWSWITPADEKHRCQLRVWAATSFGEGKLSVSLRAVVDHNVLQEHKQAKVVPARCCVPGEMYRVFSFKHLWRGRINFFASKARTGLGRSAGHVLAHPDPNLEPSASNGRWFLSASEHFGSDLLHNTWQEPGATTMIFAAASYSVQLIWEQHNWCFAIAA